MNFSKVLFESAMLFSGIFLALLLENYIDDNELREKQEKLLGELILDLNETVADIANDIESNGEYLEQNKVLINAVNKTLDELASEIAFESAKKFA